MTAFARNQVLYGAVFTACAARRKKCYVHTVIMIKYLKNNLIAGFKTPPVQELALSLSLFLLFGLSAFFVGSRGDLFEIKMLNSRLIYIVPLSLFIFPSLLEEAFFRGILIPNNTKDKGLKAQFIATFTSAISFTLWHPLNAVTVNVNARALFLNPYFLMIVFSLGILCSVTYIYSKSLWVPIMLHWGTVLMWVLFLGGRNLVLE